YPQTQYIIERVSSMGLVTIPTRVPAASVDQCLPHPEDAADVVTNVPAYKSNAGGSDATLSAASITIVALAGIVGSAVTLIVSILISPVCLKNEATPAAQPDAHTRHQLCVVSKRGGTIDEE